jgi:hypothetical protein
MRFTVGKKCRRDPLRKTDAPGIDQSGRVVIRKERRELRFAGATAEGVGRRAYAGMSEHLGKERDLESSSNFRNAGIGQR